MQKLHRLRYPLKNNIYMFTHVPDE